MSKYASALLISLIFPLLLSFWPPLNFYRNLRALFLSLFSVTALFGAWDVFATWRGHWYFDPRAVWPARLAGLPIEEWLFFPVISFCCIFTWEALKYIKGRLK
jgi:lycopene cyclase domain-containing protein